MKEKIRQSTSGTNYKSLLNDYLSFISEFKIEEHRRQNKVDPISNYFPEPDYFTVNGLFCSKFEFEWSKYRIVLPTISQFFKRIKYEEISGFWKQINYAIELNKRFYKVWEKKQYEIIEHKISYGFGGEGYLEESYIEREYIPHHVYFAKGYLSRNVEFLNDLKTIIENELTVRKHAFNSNYADGLYTFLVDGGYISGTKEDLVSILNGVVKKPIKWNLKQGDGPQKKSLVHLIKELQRVMDLSILSKEVTFISKSFIDYQGRSIDKNLGVTISQYDPSKQGRHFQTITNRIFQIKKEVEAKTVKNLNPKSKS